MKHLLKCFLPVAVLSFITAVLILPFEKHLLAREIFSARAYSADSPFFFSHGFKGYRADHSLINMQFDDVKFDPNAFIVDELF
ncbi:MAG: hypothetical protein ABH871_10130, partial [Pseudomonadota bacterium]